MKTLRAERSIFKSNSNSNSNFNSSNNDNNDFDLNFYLDDNEDGPTVDQSTDSTSSRFLIARDCIVVRTLLKGYVTYWRGKMVFWC